jgi:hypothetical protein
VGCSTLFLFSPYIAFCVYTDGPPKKKQNKTKQKKNNSSYPCDLASYTLACMRRAAHAMLRSLSHQPINHHHRPPTTPAPLSPFLLFPPHLIHSVHDLPLLSAKVDPLRERQRPRVVDGAGAPPHVLLPRVAPGLPPAARLLLAAKGPAWVCVCGLGCGFWVGGGGRRTVQSGIPKQMGGWTIAPAVCLRLKGEGTHRFQPRLFRYTH